MKELYKQDTVKCLSNRYKFNWDLISFGHELIRTTERLTWAIDRFWASSASTPATLTIRFYYWSVENAMTIWFWVSRASPPPPLFLWRSKSVSLEHFDGLELSVWSDR